MLMSLFFKGLRFCFSCIQVKPCWDTRTHTRTRTRTDTNSQTHAYTHFWSHPYLYQTTTHLFSMAVCKHTHAKHTHTNNQAHIPTLNPPIHLSYLTPPPDKHIRLHNRPLRGGHDHYSPYAGFCREGGGRGGRELVESRKGRRQMATVNPALCSGVPLRPPHTLTQASLSHLDAARLCVCL